jgi:hypothetical protein
MQETKLKIEMALSPIWGKHIPLDIPEVGSDALEK